MPGTEDFLKNEKLNSLYGYDYNGVNDKESNDEEEAPILIQNQTKSDQTKSVSHMAGDPSKLVSYTNSSSEEEKRPARWC